MRPYSLLDLYAFYKVVFLIHLSILCPIFKTFGSKLMDKEGSTTTYSSVKTPEYIPKPYVAAKTL